MPRFVILHHEFPVGHPRASHWDLMFERGETLRTWALSLEPFTIAELEAEQLADHRLAYLDYEGPVSQGRGTVTRWDEGEYRLEKEAPDLWQAELSGARFRGSLRIARKGEGSHSWRVSFDAAPITG